MFSQIFKWYATDFGDNTDSLFAYISQYLSAEKRALIEELIGVNSGPYSVADHVVYKDYDWSA